MKKQIVRWIALLLCMALMLPATVWAEGEPADAAPTRHILRVGLNYGSNALSWVKLENVVGNGYRFGYYDRDRSFVLVGATAETAVSVVKTETLYLTSGGTYSTSASGAVGTLGPYHIQLPESYPDFGTAQAAAVDVPGGFVAWIRGTYYVRTGTYDSAQAAREGQAALGIEDTTVLGTSAYSANVVKHGTTQVVFQFDAGEAGETNALGVLPGLDDSAKNITKYAGGNTYYGGFRFERISGGNMSVINMVELDDYAKGSIPYEMSASWPQEALKAQAVAARSYAMVSVRHGSHHADVCTSTCCQVYRGTARADERSDRAVDETAGQMIYYNGRLVEAVYSASNGGGSESGKNIWGSDSPYLMGKIDPYEADVADIIPNYNWTKVYTAESLKERLHANNYKCSDVVSFCVSRYSETGNAVEVQVLDAAGKTWTFSRNRVRTILGVPNIHFSIAVSGGEAIGGEGYMVAGNPELVTDITTQYAISGDGTVAPVGEEAYAITGEGVEVLTPSAVATGGAGAVYTISGAGNGHNVGLSQWGAYAMAQRGMSYLDILHFYYTDIEVA